MVKRLIRRLGTIDKRIMGVPFWHFWGALLELIVILGLATWLFWWGWHKVQK